MSTTIASKEASSSSRERRKRKSDLLLIVAATVVCLVAGTVSWLVVQPGQDLLRPLAADLIIVILFGAACYEKLRRGNRKDRFRISVLVVSLAVVSMCWTYFGVLPASVSFDSSAAKAVLQEIAHKDVGCRLVKSGSVGLLTAPYSICRNTAPSGSMVMFAVNDLQRGYAYLSGRTNGVNWFPEECSRHLIGRWWAFYSDPLLVLDGCPFGYSAHGGG